MKIPQKLAICALAVMVLTACGPSSTPDPQSIAQYAAATVAAMQMSAASQVPVSPEKATQVIEVTRIVPQTVVVRETVVVTATPEPAPTATPEPASKLGYELGPVSSYRDIINMFWFMSQITNTGTVPLGDTQIIISLKDDGGKILGVETGRPDLNVIMPGESVPVKVLALDEPKGWTKYELRVTIKEASDYIVSAYDSKLETTQATMTRDGDRYRVSGEVKNMGDKIVKVAGILVGLYDKDGDLVGSQKGYAAINPLQPGDTSPFSIEGMQVIGPATTYKIWLQGPVE